jgi:hypothetical protein
MSKKKDQLISDTYYQNFKNDRGGFCHPLPYAK